MVKIIISIIIGYLIGSISFAVIVSRLKGINIFEVGTKNPGAANVLREVGKWYGISVWLLDMLKGIFGMLIAQYVFHVHPFYVGLTGIAAVVGHCWSIFLRFKGGKGVATSGGIFLYIFPKIFLIAVATYFLVQRAPRKAWVVITGFGVDFGLILYLYRSQIKWVLPFLVIFLIVGMIANREAIREMRHENMGKKNI